MGNQKPKEQRIQRPKDKDKRTTIQNTRLKTNY